jgi:hypothetical protein
MSMQASATGHPAAEELMAYGDGEAPADVVAHVQACSTCTKQASSYTQMQGELRRSLYRFDCPDAHTLGEYQLDLLEAEHRRRVAAHAVDCDACSSELQTLRSYLAMPTVFAESSLQRARRMVATLFRPAPGLAYGGLRGTSEATTRVFQIEDVTVTVGPGQGSGTLVGLVLIAGTESHTLDGRAVRLVPTERGALTTAMDDLGNFEFEGVPAGTYALEIDLPDALVVVVEELRLD